MDPQFPEWGSSSYFTVELKGNHRLQDLLTHLYVLVPVLDNEKHYWVGEEEIEKLLRHGSGWLAAHSEKEEITRRYLKYQRDLAREALSRLVEEELPDVDSNAKSRDVEEEAIEKPLNLNEQRINAVVAALRSSGATRVVDLGCGEGRLVRALLKDRQFQEIVGVDVSHRVLKIAHERLNGYDAAAVIEAQSVCRLGQRNGRPIWLRGEISAGRECRSRRWLADPDGYLWSAVTTAPLVTASAWQEPSLTKRCRGHRTPRSKVKITIPELALVVLVGPSGAGKSTFARKHFKPTEVLSSDFCRALVSDDENSQAATKDAFEVLNFIAAKRLAAGKLVVVDATNVQPEARKPLVALAREFHVIPVAIVFTLSDRICEDRNKQRSDRNFGPHVIRQQSQQLRRSIRNLKREGFRHIFEFSTPEAIDQIEIERQPLWNNLKHEHGPFDIIGDVHGCFDELYSLLQQLGYEGDGTLAHPAGRKAVFLGDLVDRGPKIPDVLRLVMNMVESGSGLCVPGNHDIKLMRKLHGKDVRITHGLAESLEQLEGETPEFREKVAAFIDGLVSHYVLDDARLVVAHAGMKEELQGRGSGKVRDFALRFVQREPLRRVHECVFGVLALESEPVDPRL